jgi:putative drug exporter of the RND superfamily
MPTASRLPTSSESRFVRLAGWAQRNRKRALGLWLLVLAVTIAASFAVGGGDYDNSSTLPGTESQRVLDTLREQAPAEAGDSVQIVLRYPDGVASAAARERVEPMLARVSRLPGVAGVASPYADAGAVSRDGTIAYATVALRGTADEVARDDVLKLVDTARAAAGDGLQVELGGGAVRYAEPQGGGAESAGTLAALVVLVILFGSLLAASLPIVTALFAVGSAMSLIVVASHFFPIADYTPPLMSLVGLGVGIDYALIVFSRYRTELLGGRDREAALRTALDTAGRSIVFAGCTVIVGLLGLLTLGIGPLEGIAIGVSLTVAVTMIASLTLLPALIALTGRRVERSIRKRAARKAKRAERRGGAHREGDGWRRRTARIQQHPGRALLLSAGVLAMLAIPATGMRLGSADAGNDSTDATVRRAYDLLATGFGDGFNGPLVIVADGADGPAVARLRETLRRTPGVAAVAAPSTTGDVTTVIAFPDSKPQDEKTAQLVADLRDDVLPPLAHATNATYLVGGATAADDDFAQTISDRLPAFLAIVVGISSLLLMILFRSFLIPLKAALLNLLSIGAALGVVTLVFQEGLFGVQPSPIDAAIPILIFAIVFGLSMDYEVFIVSRMREEWLRSGDAGQAVREGLAATGTVVTAAAAIMVVVFGAFMLSPDRMMKQFGLGLAVAIALDAFVIRTLLMPAIMRVLGRGAWWMPRWLGARVPRVELERA